MNNRGLLVGASVIVGVGALLTVVAIAAITVRTSSTNISNDVTYTEITLNKPSGTAAGDLLIADISFKGGSSVETITAPTGWTLLARSDNEDNVGIASYWKVASTSDPSSWTWNFNVQTRGAGGITPFSGVDTANPIVGYATSTGRGAIATASSTTAVTNSRLIALFAIDRGTNNSGVMSTSTGWTKLYDAKNIGMGPTLMAEHRLETTAGTTSAATTTVSNGAVREWAAQQIALRPSIATFNVLVIGGGGGGGASLATNQAAGGGGAGGYVSNTSLLLTASTSYTITVGAGGAGGTATTRGGNGGNSSIGSVITAVGGGGGGTMGGPGSVHEPSNGGSGGGAGAISTGGTGTAGQGNNGGGAGNDATGGGGGGASAAGGDGNAGTKTGGAGGAGISSDITGTTVTRAGGGGGGGTTSGGTGGSGGSGGGGSGASETGDGSNGSANTGGGGGGAARHPSSGTYYGGAGGSGLVVIRFVTGSVTVADSTGGSCSTVGSDTVCIWTTNGTFEFIE